MVYRVPGSKSAVLSTLTRLVVCVCLCHFLYQLLHLGHALPYKLDVGLNVELSYAVGLLCWVPNLSPCL